MATDSPSLSEITPRNALIKNDFYLPDVVRKIFAISAPILTRNMTRLWIRKIH